MGMKVRNTPKTGQTKTSTMAKGKLKVDNVVSIYSEIESIVAKEVARPTEHLAFAN